MIHATDKIHAVLAQDERLLEVLTAASPAFEKLRNAALRRTMTRLVTVEQAAKIAGIDASLLVDRLNQALDASPAERLPSAGVERQKGAIEAPPTSVPEALLRIPHELVVDADVRAELRAGKEPFRRIMDAARATRRGGVLRVRALFEPAPLYAVLEKQGFSHFTERIAHDDWRVWFQRDAGAAALEPASARDADTELSPDADVIVLDVRGLEPPEPMQRTLEALATLPRGGTLVQLNVRVPQFLLPKLDERGFAYEIREQSEDLVRLFIRHKQP
jgi:uncharacterized protein (DUF2249 family)